MNRIARKIHRVVSYLVFVQMILWIAGGLTFALLPFESVVKGGAVAAPAPHPTFPADWSQRLAAQLQAPGIVGMAAHDSSQGLLLELRGEDDTRWLRMDNGIMAQRPAREQIEVYATTLYRGDGVPSGTQQYLDQPERRYLGLVDELYGITDVWQVSFDDSLGTRLYFDGETGRYLLMRNNFWVFYDAMWRLHIMDYSGGDDFNNKLLTVFVLLAAVFAISGLILTLGGLKRLWRKRFA